MITKIYLITGIDGIDNKVYIGKTISKTRERDHKKKFGVDITFTFIDEVNSTDRKDWEPLENYWIDQFRQWGFNLVNKNKGGGGPEFHSQESRLLISKKSLERDPQIKEKISNTLKNSKFAKELSDRQSGEGNISKREDVRLKISKTISELWKDPKYINSRQPEPLVQCPHCGTIGKNRIMKRWHFYKCKYLSV